MADDVREEGHPLRRHQQQQHRARGRGQVAHAKKQVGLHGREGPGQQGRRPLRRQAHARGLRRRRGRTSSGTTAASTRTTRTPTKVTSPDLKNALDALLAGQPVAKTETRRSAARSSGPEGDFARMSDCPGRRLAAALFLLSVLSGRSRGRRSAARGRGRRGGATSRRSRRRRDSVVLVNFWATWCVPCREEFPDLVRLEKAYRGQGLSVVGVSTDLAEGPAGRREVPGRS